MKTLPPKLARRFAAGLIGAVLAAPMVASAAVHPDVSKVVAGNTGLLALPDPPPLPPPPPESEQMIRDKAATSLGIQFTGPALSGLETVPGGARIRYQNCDIYYSRATGAHEVHGGIRDKYNAKGGAWSNLGLPATDELRTGDPSGRYNEFFNSASIYWSPNTGPMVVRGGIRAYWVGKTAENSPFGFPTSDERVLGPGQAYNDFQNSVIYFEGSDTRLPEYASLSRAQMKNVVRNVLKGNGFSLPIDSVSFQEISNTGQDFWQSRNRVITFRIQGSIPRNNDFDPDYTLDLGLLFCAQKEADGSTTLRVALHHWYLKVSGLYLNPLNADTEWAWIWGNPDVSTVVYHLYNVFGPDSLPRRREDLGSVRPKLIDLAIPGGVNILSFKVQPDGGLMLYLQPNLAGALAKLAAQREFDALAK